MIEQRIKAATCRVSCGEESGTAWVIAEGIVITARHCVKGCIDDGMPVELFFPNHNGAILSRIVAQSEESDLCLLSLDDAVDAEPLAVSLELPREGEIWQTFGYPKDKPTVGHRLSGTVAQVLETPKLKIDLDLSVDPDCVVQVYHGFSGAAVICEGVAVGIISKKLDGTVAALSLNQTAKFLADNGVPPANNSKASSPLLAERGAFIEAFAKEVQSRAGRYLFLAGAHGYGKSTFCENFRADDKKLINLGAYFLSDPNSALGASYRAQPQVFLDWLTTAIAGRITGKPPRKEEKSYADQIRQTAQYLDEFSKYCAQSGRQGMLFIDGLNEIPGGAMLDALLGLLPAKLPPHVTVILTAPNFDNIAVPLAGKVKTSDVFELPPLPDSACYRYCQKALKPERRSPGLVGRICEKAKGHPLYLRYLIEYSNNQAADDDLADFPVLTGPIEEYYQRVWAKILPDGDAVNLLALMARLRWGISLTDFAKTLNPSEVAQFVTVISRIRHLLAEEDTTAIYHASFAQFVIAQTARTEASAFRRLANFCTKNPDVRYCALNRVFHLSVAADKVVFSECNQTWFDAAVTLGVEPDALIADVDAVVKRAAMEASPDEFIRLTLLAQRISFRYDTLFAQSARLIAEALIVLGRPSEALQHVIRLNTLIVGPDDALEIAFLLHQHGYDYEALTLLGQVEQRIVESYDSPIQLRHFLELCAWRIQVIFLVRLADGWSGMNQVMSVMDMARRACDETLPPESPDHDVVLCPILARSPSYFLTFRDHYADLARLKAFQKSEGVSEAGFPPPHHLRTLCLALLDFESAVDDYHLAKGRKSLSQLFADLAELIPTIEIEAPLASAVTDTLIRFGAPASVVELFGAKGGKQTPRPLQIKAKNGVDVNRADLHECLCTWRISAFLDSTFRGLSSGIIAGTGWFESIEHLIGALYCSDGSSRRANADSDDGARSACYDRMKVQVIDPLRFTLQQRAAWSDSYAIPETALPWVYRQLTELLSDCFPEKLPEWLDSLVADADGQWGMYSEGFRASIFHVLNELTREKPTDELAPKLLALLHAWRDHVMRGVENRHELVPEILRMIPIFDYLGAEEEAARLYQRLLSVSMGPTWYKEDQLGIMTEVLSNICVSKEVELRLPKVAGYLERASGEMTFQRFVRAEKSSLLGQIARQGKFGAALAYFRRQCCGSTEELWAEAQQGPIDKVGPLQGNRFPGGALDDQAAVLALVENSAPVSWPLRWALLETFHCGDSRHLSDYAEAFAKIVNEVGAIPELIRRVEIIATAETPSEKRTSFAAAFRSALRPELRNAFATLFADLSPQIRRELPSAKAHREADDDVVDGMFHPGVFGRSKALRDADKLIEEAERQLILGNWNAAKAAAVKVLKTAQDGDWGIWGNLSDSAQRAKEILVQNEVNAASVVRYYAPLIEEERYVPKWIPAQHLIGQVGSLLTEAESLKLLDAVIEHVRLVVGDATQEIQAFSFLSEDTPELSPDVLYFRFFVWLCNHPQWLRRERAAAMLLWLVEQLPELFSHAVGTAFSMDDGYGPDVLCGVLDGASVRDPAALWDKVAGVLDLTKVTQELRHVSRMVVLGRLATRAEKTGSASAKSAAALIKCSFTGRQGSGANPKLPIWAGRLAEAWRQFGKMVSTDAATAWETELERLCSPLSITDALSLEAAVSTSVRENLNAPFNRWASKLRYALNLALWSRMPYEGVSEVEAALRLYNPSQPERTVQAMSNSVTDQLMVAIKTGNYAAVLGTNSEVLLNYHGMVVNTDENGMSHVEVLCLLQPISNQRGIAGEELEQFFQSSEIPVTSTVRTPFETCCRLDPCFVFFGNFTPSVPVPFFQNLVGAKDEDFIRQNWRYGRRNEIRGFGQPERIGCSLSISRKSMKVPNGFKLAWLVWLDGDFVTCVDEHNKRLM